MTSIREAADLPDVAVAVDEGEDVVVPELPDSVVSEEPEEPVVAEELEAAVVVLAANVVEAAADPLAEAEAAALVALATEELPLPLAALALPETAGPVELFTNGKSGVKLYPSGPTFETFEAGPMMISMA
jgi:hypothetical protein